MADTKIVQLWKLWSIECFSKIFTENGRVGRIIIDSNGDTLTKSTKLFSDEDMCTWDLRNTFTRLQKISNDHIMGELEY